jgi:transcriptional regulator with XRE-family HTH domain
LDIPYEIRRIVLHLRLALRRSGVSIREASAALDLHQDYLSQIFRGRSKLKVRTVLEVLAVLGKPAAEFYGEVYGFAAELPPLLFEPAAGGFFTGSPGEEGGGEERQPLTAEELAKYHREARRRTIETERDPAHRDFEVQRLTERLWLELRKKGLTQREASERLGFHRDYLSQVLRENVEPKVEHVMLILEFLGLSPDLFYEEHYGARTRRRRPGRRLPAGLAGADVEDLLRGEPAAIGARRTLRRREERAARREEERRRREAKEAAEAAAADTQAPEPPPEGEAAPAEGGTAKTPVAPPEAADTATPPSSGDADSRRGAEPPAQPPAGPDRNGRG